MLTNKLYRQQTGLAKTAIACAALLIMALWLPASAATAELLQGKDHWQNELEQSEFSGAVLIANSHGVIFHHSYGWSDRENQRAFDEDTVFDIGSLTKQFTATAIMLLAEQGKLSLSVTIDNYFPKVPADKKDITLHHLLSHSSGLPTNFPRGSVYQRMDSDAFTSQVFKLPLIASPGETYNYSNVGYGLLAQVIEITSGENWEAYIRQNLLLPAGLKQTGYRLLDVPQERLAINYGADPNWLQRMLGLQAKSRSVGDSLQHLREEPGQYGFEGAGGFQSTTDDMYAWYLALSSGQILSSASWRQMFALHIAENSQKTSHYGYGWAIDSQHDTQRIYHTGSNGYSYATFDYFPETDVFMFTASNDIDNYPYALMKVLRQSLLSGAADKPLRTDSANGPH